MLKKSLLLFSLLLLTGCVERGFKLTVNTRTHTVTAIKSVDILKEKTANTATDMEKMNKAVTKEQKKQNINQVSEKSKVDKKVENIKDYSATKTEKPIVKQKEEVTKQETIAREKEIEKRRALLEAKLKREKEAQNIAAQKERMRLAKKAYDENIAQEKREKELKMLKEEKEKKVFAQKLAMEKAAREKKEKEEKLALERKIAKEKALQRKKEQEEKAALERKIALEKQKAEQKSKLQKEQKAEALRKQAAAEKLRQEREAAVRKAKAEEKKSIRTAEALNFKPSTQTYQKFGTSEIHGHVVYLTPGGQEISLKNTKIYLVPKNTTTDYWFNNYYLENKESTSLSKTTVNYINATHLNLEKNFAFYGLATGTYYVIIESNYPSSIAKNKKVYIAKKIDVEKYKKIMTVFSKKL